MCGIACFFFQAEDGIRDLVRSRGLGDVYKRQIYIIDRQPFDWSLTTWLGVYDLAYAMLIDWDTPTRRALEWPVLRRYHDELRRRGVMGYSLSLIHISEPTRPY